MQESYDVVIIGGGPAGLSAALTLSRGGRSVYLIDAGKGRNAPASHMMNFPSRDGTPPNEFRQLIQKDLAKYPKCKIVKGEVSSLVRKENGFIINQTISAKKILLAHGIKDILLPIPGMKELWGKSIFHCPYCHGYEHQGAAMGILGSGDQALHYATLLKGLTQDIIVFTNGDETIDRKALEQNGVKIYTNKISSLIHEGENLQAVKLESGESIPRSFLFFRPTQELSTNLGTKLGCELTELGHYKIDQMYMTTQAGIFAAGDITTPMQSVINACSTGSIAGATINYSIMREEFDSLKS